MAKRPIFVTHENPPLAVDQYITFDWNPGFALSQKQKNILSLHEVAKQQLGLAEILEVSSKSTDALGRSLSAFQLQVVVPGEGWLPLESAFQGSKVFSKTGKLVSAYRLSPRDAKSAARLVNDTEQLTAFEFAGHEWSLEPKSWFYDWLFLRAVRELDSGVQRQISGYQAFTDIEFNPGKSFSCQARSCAIAASLIQRGELSKAVEDANHLLSVAYSDSPDGLRFPQEPSARQSRLC